MSTFIIVLIVIVAILLVVVVLAQNPKGGGLASGFGGSSATQFMGVKKTGDFLEQTTWVLAMLLLTLSLTANIMVSDPSDNTETTSGSKVVDDTRDNGSKNTPPAQNPGDSSSQADPEE